MNASVPIEFGVILLAAGASRRMGRPKLLLPWGDRSVIARVTGTYRAAGARQLAAVHAPGDEALVEELRRLAVETIPNPDAPAAEMFSSVCRGLSWPGWAPGISHLVIAPGDMPAVSSATLRALFGLATAHPDRICQPFGDGRCGHPVVVPRVQAGRILDGGYAHLRGALADIPVLTLATDDIGIHADLDTPEEFQALKNAAKP